MRRRFEKDCMQSFVRSKSVVSRVIAGETLIIPVRKGVGDLASIYSLNEVATSIWETVSTPRTREEIISAIGREFAADEREVSRDVDSFLSEMNSAGLIIASEAAA
jgi:Coenzyme PQQ synthesis protein D (PqqD)